MNDVPLCSLTNEELKDLLQSDDKLCEFVDNTPHVLSLRQMCEQLMIQNEALAKSNLEFKEDYTNGRCALMEISLEVKDLQKRFENLTTSHEVITDKFAPSNLQENLMIGAALSEEESENIADEFLSKKINIDSFLSQYIDKRIETHLRKFKGDKLGLQLRELECEGFNIY